MNKKTLTELDFFRIRDTIAGYCVSDEGTASLKEKEPGSNRTAIAQLKLLGTEWMTYLQSSRAPALSHWAEIAPLFPVMKTEGATLSRQQLFDLGSFCTTVKNTVNALKTSAQELETAHLSALAQTIEQLDAPEREIFRILDKDGQLKDLPELRAIRRKISALRNEITSLIHKYTSDQSLSTVLESNVPAFRADRQVLAVHAGMKNRIPGIIHEVSQTGQTVYIEPEDVVRKNNDLVQEEFSLQQEIRKIFRELTARLRPFTGLFERALPVMLQLDTTCAAAKWGMENNGVYALSCDEKQESSEETAVSEPPLILQGRHPLLGSRAVPVDVRFRAGKRVLIITGPNTGGKTVTLKMIALFALMNQSGFPVPAAEGTRLPVFSNVFADIGDEQSLDQSLSTFSGHMKNIAEALSQADEKSLVLLDELGSGTDPQEGGAIAMAALDTLLEKKAFVLVTTHHGILKNYGYTHPACINASVEFNTDTLSPTYHLLMGVPGESHALEIAERSGLPPDVTKKARSYLTNEQADVSTLIKGLTAKHAELNALEQEFRSKEHQINERRRRVDLKDLRLRQKELELKKERSRDESRFVKESRSQLENLVRTLRESEITHEKAVEVKKFIAELTETEQTRAEQLETEEQTLHADETEIENKIAEQDRKSKKTGTKTPRKRLKNAQALALATPVVPAAGEQTAPQEFKEGAAVAAGPSRMQGVLLHQERKGLWSVQFGSIKMNFKEKDLLLVDTGKEEPLTPTVTIDLAGSDETESPGSLTIKSDSGGLPVYELRLLGMHYDEAIKILERQLDLCTLKNVHEFCIIHGKGTGVLQQGVQDYLSHYPGVKEYHFANPEDGGTGKTWVTMD
jgi:DNA mismatch repair protein MutS2